MSFTSSLVLLSLILTGGSILLDFDYNKTKLDKHLKDAS